jgi:hypothetical protein
MPATFDEITSLSVNPLVSYLHGLLNVKTGLPHGHLVCVSASPTITTTDGLIQLATAIGPHVAILQVHADIVDDWSSRTVHELTFLSKKHGFLLWEGGRLLNASSDIPGRSAAEFRDQRSDEVEMVRKRYTNGVVSVASWSCLSTMWPFPAPARQQESDILIPTLRGAAREAVVKIAQVIRTEITADRTLAEEEEEQSNDDVEMHAGDHLAATHLRPVDLSVRNSLEPPIRRASTISLTRSITQRSEPTSPSSRDVPHWTENVTVDENVLQYAEWSDALSPPPLLARGLVLGLPSVGAASPFTDDYRDSCLAAGRANRSFVVGFLCNESWPAITQRSNILSSNKELDPGGKSNGVSVADDQRDKSFIIFSPLPAVGQQRNPNVSSLTFSADPLATSDTFNSVPASSLSPPASRLYTIIAQALASIDQVGEQDGGRVRTDTSLLHIPIVTLGL